MQQQRLFAFHMRKWKSLVECNSCPRVLISLHTPTFLLQQTESRRLGRGEDHEATFKYSKIVPVHAMNIRRGIRVQHRTLLNKKLHDLAVLSADVRLIWSQSPSGSFGEENFSSPSRDSNQDSQVCQPSHYTNWATALIEIGYEVRNVKFCALSSSELLERSKRSITCPRDGSL